MKAKSNPNISVPLIAYADNGLLTMQLGIETLEWASKPKNGGPLDQCKVDCSRRLEWAKDVALEMMRQDELGQTPLGEFLDEMMQKAADNGSAALRWKGKK